MKRVNALLSRAVKACSMAETLLEVTGLRVRYGTFEAVKGVSFTLHRGEILGIVGESGSGKSTIARALMNLTPCVDRGAIRLNARSVQMVFQDAVGSLNPRMTVRQMLSEVIKIKKTARTANELLDLVGLSPAVLDQYPRELSGGQCQRISIARALAAHPDILIADEPVSALDVSVQARILNLLRDLRTRLGLTILLIAHDLAVVKNICDSVSVMEKGVFVDTGTAQAVFEHPTSAYTRHLLEAVPDVARALASRGL